MKVLDLFSGIGGFSLGLERAGMETIAFCEINPYCQKILKHHWPDVPVFTDIKKLTADDLPEQPQKSLTTEVVDSMGGRNSVTGQLNPQWVEWLMGYPTGWTELRR